MFLVRPIASNTKEFVHTYIFLPPESRKKSSPVVTVCAEKVVPFFVWNPEQTHDFVESEKNSLPNFTGRRMCPECFQRTQKFLTTL